MKNLEPRIHRQRLIIEAKYQDLISKEDVRNYLISLADELEMHLHLPEPIITSATGKGKDMHAGFEGVVFWIESGAVIYVWENFNFLSVDIYSCKPFDSQKAVDFTSKFFNTTKIEFKLV